MINPRTAPYTSQRLTAVRQELARPLLKAPYTNLPLTSIRSDLLMDTLETRDLELLKTFETASLHCEKSPVENLRPLTMRCVEPTTDHTKTFGRYVPYIIGGVIISLAIYFYLESRKEKEKQGASHG